MVPDYQSQIVRLTRDVAGLDKDAAATAKKESELIGKINRAQDAVNRTNSASMVRSRLREIEQGSKNLAAIKEKQSDISRRRAQKYNNLIDYRNRQAREDEKARKRAAEDERRLMRDREMHQRRMSSDLRRQSLVPMESFATGSTKTYDFFICHASEDKDDFVRELAKLLRAGDAEVWYDEFTLKVGSRLRREIDRGLLNARYGIVVVSSHFFAKEWPQRELDGLFSLDTQGHDRILPIWHKVTKDEVRQHSPTLADIIALNTGVQSTQEIAEELLNMIR